MEELRNTIESLRQTIKDQHGYGTTDEESSQRTVKDEDVEEANDALRGVPQEGYYYHHYAMSKEYTYWVFDESWPETDSDQSSTDSEMFDEWLEGSLDVDECSSLGRSSKPEV